MKEERFRPTVVNTFKEIKYRQEDVRQKLLDITDEQIPLHQVIICTKE